MFALAAPERPALHSLVFVDSFRSVVLASSKQSNPNNNLAQFVQHLCRAMTTRQATTF
jgi:circadian clock protein KaiC